MPLKRIYLEASVLKALRLYKITMDYPNDSEAMRSLLVKAGFPVEDKK